MAAHTRYLITTNQGQEMDLTTAKELRSNNLYPFGLHNYAIYRTDQGEYVKGTNSGNLHLMLDTYETINEQEAQTYSHPFRRIED
ncbi:MAG: hypothetical protein ACO1OQ_05090 [Rufibacter sp.]